MKGRIALLAVASALVMLAGYFAAPHGIWKLCVGTHGHGRLDTPTSQEQS